jgi:hypothetical protein
MGATMKKASLLMAVLAALSFGCISDAFATKKITYNMAGRLCSRHGGMGPVGANGSTGCTFCGVKSCSFVSCDYYGDHCGVNSIPQGARPIKTKGGTNAAPIKNGKPVQAPPPKGSNSTNAAPITSGKPVQASPGSGGGGGRLK